MYSASTSLQKRLTFGPPPSAEPAGEPITDIPAAPASEEPARRLNAARGVLTGLVLGAGSWVAIFALIRLLKP